MLQTATAVDQAERVLQKAKHNVEIVKASIAQPAMNGLTAHVQSCLNWPSLYSAKVPDGPMLQSVFSNVRPLGWLCRCSFTAAVVTSPHPMGLIPVGWEVEGSGICGGCTSFGPVGFCSMHSLGYGEAYHQLVHIPFRGLDRYNKHAECNATWVYAYPLLMYSAGET